MENKNEEKIGKYCAIGMIAVAVSVCATLLAYVVTILL